MSEPFKKPPPPRYFRTSGNERTDELGFLDPSTTNSLVQFDEILKHRIAWVVGPPWLGKSWVARHADFWIRQSTEVLGASDAQCHLTELGPSSSVRDVLPPWWDAWCKIQPLSPAAWLVDGVDEKRAPLLHQICIALATLPDTHQPFLNLIFFSRPYQELGEFKKKVRECFSHAVNEQEYWLAKVDRVTAQAIVGPERFDAVCGVISNNSLQTVSGLPAVLLHLERFADTLSQSVTVGDVWKEVLFALLGEASTNYLAPTTPKEERLAAAKKVAAVLSLTGRGEVRWHSPSVEVPTLDGLFGESSTRQAAYDVTTSNALARLPEQGTFCFVRQNVQDWFTAFALNDLPVPELRSALSARNGTLAPRMVESARLLWAISKRSEVKDAIRDLNGGILLPSDAAPLAPPEAVRSLDDLEAYASNAPWGLRLPDNREALKSLYFQGIEDELTRRLLDPNRNVKAKRLLLEIAEQLEIAEATDAALQIVVDPYQDDGLRLDSLSFIFRFGGPKHLDSLVEPIARSNSTSEMDARLRGSLLYKLLKDGRFSVWEAALHAPKARRRFVDGRGMLLHEIERRLTPDDMQRLLPHLRLLYDRHKSDDEYERVPDFITRITEWAATSSDPQDVLELAHFALSLLDHGSPESYRMAHQIACRLESSAIARHVLCVHDLREPKASARIGGGLRDLISDDWRWLYKKANGPWSKLPEIWHVVYWLAKEANGNGRIENDEWNQVIESLELREPGWIETYEKNREEQQRGREKRRQKQSEEASKKREPRALAELVAEIVGNASMSAVEKMRDLSWICFVRHDTEEGHVLGHWSGLAPRVQATILEACRAGLETGNPSAVPRKNSFTGTILAEAAAFVQVAKSDNGWLSPGNIKKWLPAALFDSSENWGDLVRLCWTVSQESTQSVLVGAMANESERSSSPSSSRLIPSECWTAAMTEQLRRVIIDESAGVEARCELLQQLAIREPVQTIPTATIWGRLPLRSDEGDRLRRTGRDVMLVLAPDEALDVIECDFESRGTACLTELSVFSEWSDDFRVDWTKWPSERLGRLAALLVRAFPPSEDPEFEGGHITRENDLRHFVRDRMVRELLDRKDEGAIAAVARLADGDPKLANWIHTVRTSEAANRYLEQLRPLEGDDDVIPLQPALKLLDAKDYRLVRSEDDLLAAIMAVLEKVQSDIARDLPMLFHAPARQSKKSAGRKPRKSRITSVRRPLEEDALQAYIRRRLEDGLPRMIDDVEVDLVREEQVKRRRRFDIRVAAPKFRSQELANVVIEIKWSTNKDVHDSMISQLAQKYLLEEGNTHGIYLVGWTGEWRATNRKQRRDLLALQKCLNGRCKQFCRTKRGKQLTMRSLVLDARWSD